MLEVSKDRTLDPTAEQLAHRRRDEPRSRLEGRDRVVEMTLAAGFAVVAAGLAALAPWNHDLSPFEAVALVTVYAVASRVQFGVGAGYTVPTQVVFIPMLLVLPAPVVPAMVAAAIALGNLPDYVTGRTHPARMLLTLGDAWHALGPALVLVVAGVDGFAWSDWPVWMLAFGAQLGTDFAISAGREWWIHDASPRSLANALAWVYIVDLLLTPVGLLVAASGSAYAALLGLPLVALLAIFARERQGRLDAALELSQAYRGTAMLLGDVLEDADEYTGVHSRSVVTLSLEVATRMGLDARAKRNVEFAALLHDIGKIAIPESIIHKPGPLTSDEWRVMRTHTLEGHRMLQQVGGVLAEVGNVVRASHERWDGRGYPDGLAGEAIPVEASIVSCCDAFDAMTTNRSYRPAMPIGEAIGELLSHSGTQFRPEVVEHIVAIVASRPRVQAELTVVAA